MKLQITVTKEILQMSMMCRVAATRNCAIALAVRDIFPNASVDGILIHTCGGSIKMPIEATDFVCAFDGLKYTPEKRLELPEITFEVEVPDSVIEKIDISGVYENHPTLKLIPA